MWVLMGTEFVLAVLAVYLAALVRFLEEMPDVVTTERPLVFAAFIVMSLMTMGLYQPQQRLRLEGVLARIVVAFVAAAVGLALTYYIFPRVVIGRGWWLLSLGIAFFFVLGTRTAFFRLADHDGLRRRVVVYGAGKRAATLVKLRRRSDQRGFKLIAFIPVPGERRIIDDERVDDSAGSLFELAQKHAANEIVLAMDERRHVFPIKDLLDCKLAGMTVTDVLSFLERERGKVSIDLMTPAVMIFAAGFTRRGSRVFSARALDIIGSVVLLAVSWPMLLLTAAAILIEDGRPILYRQTRVGFMGKPFELLKFRSMTKDAERDGARWAAQNDARVTRVGAVIRRLRLDELPQILNVLRGDMSLIGPRPERPEFVAQLAEAIPYYHERHCVRPGLTGWAQLSYPYGSSEKDAREKLEYDLYYIKNQSIIFDLVILLQTVEVVLWRKGAR